MNDKEVYICPECANYGLICVTCTNANKFKPKKKEKEKMNTNNFPGCNKCARLNKMQCSECVNHNLFIPNVITVNPGESPTEVYKQIVGKYNKPRKFAIPEIKKVIFNPPATIIFWMDNSKTVVKAQNDEPFDPEKGMALAICKKLFGNKGNYFNEFKKWTEPYEENRKMSLTKEETFEFEFSAFDNNLLKKLSGRNNGEITFTFTPNKSESDN